MLYADGSNSGGGLAVIEGQELVTSEGKVQVVALQNELYKSGTGRVTIELRPAENISDTLPEGDNLTVTIPTRLSESDWESKTDLTDSAAYDSVTDTGDNLGIDDSNIYNLTLSTSTANLTVDTVGVQEVPSDPKQNANAAVGGSGNLGGPTGSRLADNVELVESGTQVNNGDLVVRFRNDNSQSVTFERARLVEYDESSAPGNRDPIGVVEYEYGNVELAEGDPLENVAGPTVSNGANVDIRFSPVATGASGGSGSNAKVESGDQVEFTVEFNDGSQRTYQYTVP